MNGQCGQEGQGGVRGEYIVSEEWLGREGGCWAEWGTRDQNKFLSIVHSILAWILCWWFVYMYISFLHIIDWILIYVAFLFPML